MLQVSSFHAAIKPGRSRKLFSGKTRKLSPFLTVISLLPWLILGHCLGDSLTRPIHISAFLEQEVTGNLLSRLCL